MKQTIVIDLDGTMSNCTARQHLVRGKKRDYTAFHSRLLEDPMNEWCRAIVNSFWLNDGEEKVVFVTARPKRVEADTRRWLSDNLGVVGRSNELYMLRDDGDSTPAIDLKRAWLKVYGPERVLFAVDDDPRNAAMFKEEGVTCLLAPGWSKV